MKNLHYFKKNIFSQNGEDGVILEIIKRIFTKKKLVVCEFGAADGKHLSNTFNLVKRGMVSKAIYIESNNSFYSSLLDLSKEYQEIIPINCEVSHKKNDNNTLDKILLNLNIEKDIDMISIDIDSYDLDAFRTIKFYEPKMVIIEAGKQKYGVLSEHSLDKKLNSFSQIYNEFKNNFFLIFYNGNLFFLNKIYFDKKKVEKNFYINDKLHYYLHRIYSNYENQSIYKKIILKLIPKNVFLISLILKIMNK